MRITLGGIAVGRAELEPSYRLPLPSPLNLTALKFKIYTI